jgi:nucleotide-binding universal stress UspA family protein
VIAAVSGTAAASAVQPPRRIGRILLATDLSPASEGAADQAILLARDLRADLLVVSVIDGRGSAHGTAPLDGSEGPPQRMDQKRATREHAAQGVVVRGQREGVNVTFLVWEGEPGPAIVEAAEAERVDMIVVGTRGRNRVERAVLGSVSDHVIRHAHCPVLIVRA